MPLGIERGTGIETEDAIEIGRGKKATRLVVEEGARRGIMMEIEGVKDVGAAVDLFLSLLVMWMIPLVILRVDPEPLFMGNTSY
jgi:hypothetical protein